MRFRRTLVTAVLGSTLTLGAAAVPAQAMPMQAQQAISATASTNAPSAVPAYEYYGQYAFSFECTFAAHASGYSRWYCAYSNFTGLWELFVDYRS
ncbi:hypothetical protein [Streptomyces sp. NPDC000618]|uniref:hypothetical protein n=1 Tax=Streptomyces sp. NPDC000618 TaxID=3154265 RepID=UPI003319296E